MYSRPPLMRNPLRTSRIINSIWYTYSFVHRALYRNNTQRVVIVRVLLSRRCWPSCFGVYFYARITILTLATRLSRGIRLKLHERSRTSALRWISVLSSRQTRPNPLYSRTALYSGRHSRVHRTGRRIAVWENSWLFVVDGLCWAGKKIPRNHPPPRETTFFFYWELIKKSKNLQR